MWAALVNGRSVVVRGPEVINKELRECQTVESAQEYLFSISEL
jgi:hypothetical protein